MVVRMKDYGHVLLFLVKNEDADVFCKGDLNYLGASIEGLANRSDHFRSIIYYVADMLKGKEIESNNQILNNIEDAIG